ncbi:alpha/beta hydrolase [Luteimonas huabeiensis]|uniref:alpha/beta hydrolase n=1 Tax=Luteimonas huabeiensis TaxID=1244513 RepID=UPI000465E6CD|nr:alpha/beta hydrolase-fold protein [Luteimonas huabeiensis]
MTQPLAPRAVAVAVATGLLTAGCLAVPMPAAAQQRNPQQTIGETVADRASAHYAFERFTVSSADRSRTWRVQLAVPKSAPPPGGFPAFWMLDGNAALIEFDDALLAELAAQPEPHVLVFVGYDNDLRIDSAARTRDYTPVEGERPMRDGTTLVGGGGADALLETIERQIRPELRERVAIDPARQALWGHSLAGLFALHTLYTRPGAFAAYAAGSPSLWWGDGALLDAPERRFAAHNAGRRVRVLLSLGGGERARSVDHRDLSDPRVRVHLRRIEAAPPDSAERLAERLSRVEGVEVEYREFPGLTHGPMFRASLMWALHAIAGVADRSGTPSPAGDLGPAR